MPMPSFYFHSDINPASLAVNKKHLIASHLPPEVKQAQDDLIVEMKASLINHEGRENMTWLDGTTGSIYEVRMDFGFKSDNSDIDGPIKRVLDALEKALVARGYHWKDRMVYSLIVDKYITRKPNMTIVVTGLE
jgi:Holliday junction resolvase RusA-like endonuclease